MSYSEKLEQVKADYPFEAWSERFDSGLEQYTPENIDATKSIVDQLIAILIEVGVDANEAEKVSYFKVAVEALNDLNDELDGELIETEEREELCELFDSIAIAAGIDVSEYGDGDGIASEWRDW